MLGEYGNVVKDSLESAETYSVSLDSSKNCFSVGRPPSFVREATKPGVGSRAALGLDCETCTSVMGYLESAILKNGCGSAVFNTAVQAACTNVAGPPSYFNPLNAMCVTAMSSACPSVAGMLDEAISDPLTLCEGIYMC